MSEDITKEQLYEILNNSVFENNLELFSNRIKEQIDGFFRQGLTYRQIGRAINYWYDTLNHDINDTKRFGIGIVPSVYEQADSHFNQINANRLLREKRMQMFQEQQKQKKEVRIVKPRK